jgi:selenocysteine-specific elongation factor
MPRLILGTAGHIDHGKTELVRALTGVDTDRLKEEKERGITIDLGFAELDAGDDLRLGVVDVPGHEGFVRNMLAGATGMDLVLLVVAADEGVMPQTREHLAIVTLLGVERLVVSLTKCDLVDEDWLDLVRDEVRALLSGTPYAAAPLVPTSARSGAGLEALQAALREVAATVEADDASDLARLPVDRVFTVRGTGTVVTGTLWSGTLRVGERVRVLPGDLTARIRGLQVHGRDVEVARAGERTAVALTGTDVERAALARGQTLVSSPAWTESSLITARVRVLADVDWALERGQRVRVHLGTAERMARLVLLEDEALMPGEEGWAQLRLEAPAVARARERFVLRSYSPVVTVGGGVVAEPAAPKRSSLEPEAAEALRAVTDGGVEGAISARADAAGWRGEPRVRLPVSTGLTPRRIDEALAELPAVSRPVGASRGTPTAAVVGDAVISAAIVAEGVRRIEAAVDAFHDREPLRPGVDVEALRQALPAEAHPGLADALLERLEAEEGLAVREGIASRPGFRVELRPAQAALLQSLIEAYRSAGLAPPAVSDLPPELRESPDLWPLLRLLETDGRLRRLDAELFIWSEAIEGAGVEVRRLLGGRTGLGPADFKDALPVTRKHLLPILSYFDQVGLTLRRGNVREVPPA